MHPTSPPAPDSYFRLIQGTPTAPGADLGHTMSAQGADMNADVEKGHHVRRSSDIERPVTHISDHHDDFDDDDDEKHSQHTKEDEEAVVGDDEKTRDHANDLVPATTIGEPSGQGIYEGEEPVSQRRTRSRSRASSARSRALTIVPRAKRRGLFGRFAIVPEVERPYDYKNSTKWTITFAISLATAAAPLGSSIFYPALDQISEELHTSKTIANMSVALYMLAMSIFPLWWSSFSETLGRRTIYLTSFSLFVVFSILCANSTNMTMLIVFRTCGGGASASVQAVGAGTIADIWESFERGRAMSIFYLGPLLGPLLAPIIGGVLAQELGWQSTMYFLAIYGFCCWLLLFFFLPETLAQKTPPALPVTQDQDTEDLTRITTTESAKRKTKKFGRVMKRLFLDPLSVLLFLQFPAVVLTVLVAAIAFGALFIANIAIQQGFSSPPYGYSQLIVGLLYAPPGLGYICASFFGGKWLDKIMAREARKAGRYNEQGKLILLPEDRMRENIWIANTVYPLSLLTFGWTLKYGIHWIVPSIALAFFGVSSMLVFAAATTMLTEFVRKRSSAGVAVNNFVRNILSCVGVIVASPWIDAVGVGWLFTTVCIFCMVVGYTGIFFLKRNAQQWRKKMDVWLDEHYA